jgi:UDPglucose 6-dehydrogenase
MKVLVIGLGYVGLTNAAYLAYFHPVIGFDVNVQRIQDLQQHVDYLTEPGLMRTLKANQKNLHFVDQIEPTLSKADVVIVAVPTPEGEEGKTNLQPLLDVISLIIQNGKKSQRIIIRSTIPPGTSLQIQSLLKEKHREDLVLIFMPEFLALGQALNDTKNPKRVVIGCAKPQDASILKNLYAYRAKIPFLVTDFPTAELTKYAANGFLATKLSFINEISQLSERIGADIQTIVKGMSLDPRIGPLFMQPGLGFGGSCLPKDLKALRYVAKNQGVSSAMVEATLTVNQQQTHRFVTRVLERFHHDIKQKKIAVLGLSYKGSTSDVSNSPAFAIIDHLTDQGAIIFAYDKLATFEFFSRRGEKPCLAYATVLKDALQDADVAIILNDAKEIKAIKPKDFLNWMKTPIVFDGRNLFSPANMKGIEYHSIGRPTTK